MIMKENVFYKFYFFHNLVKKPSRKIFSSLLNNETEEKTPKGIRCFSKAYKSNTKCLFNLKDLNNKDVEPVTLTNKNKQRIVKITFY